MGARLVVTLPLAAILSACESGGDATPEIVPSLARDARTLAPPRGESLIRIQSADEATSAALRGVELEVLIDGEVTPPDAPGEVGWTVDVAAGQRPTVDVTLTTPCGPVELPLTRTDHELPEGGTMRWVVVDDVPGRTLHLYLDNTEGPARTVAIGAASWELRAGARAFPTLLVPDSCTERSVRVGRKKVGTLPWPAAPGPVHVVIDATGKHCYQWRTERYDLGGGGGPTVTELGRGPALVPGRADHLLTGAPTTIEVDPERPGGVQLSTTVLLPVTCKKRRR